MKTYHPPGLHDPGSGTQSASLIGDPAKTVLPSIWRSLCPILPIPPVSSLCTLFHDLKLMVWETALFHPQFHRLSLTATYLCASKHPHTFDIAFFCYVYTYFSLSPFSHARPHIFRKLLWQYLHYLVSS